MTTKKAICKTRIENDIERLACHSYYMYSNLTDIKENSLPGAKKIGCCGYIYNIDNHAHVWIDTCDYLSDDPLEGLLEYQYVELHDGCDEYGHKQTCGTRNYKDFIHDVIDMLERNYIHGK